MGAVLLAILLSACSISPKQFAGTPGEQYLCLRHAIRVDIPAPENGLVSPKLIASIKAAKFDEKFEPDADPVSESMLFLSGGSQHGAFGAGFLNRWSDLRESKKLPRFRVVTGISTGALQSTLAFIRDPSEIIDRYATISERELLRSNTNASLNGSKSEAVRAALTIGRKGSIAELTGLRAQLLGAGPQDGRAILSDTRLRKVAAEASASRKLFVGAVELDTGAALAFDLTSIASDYVVETAPSTKEALRHCYAEALIASSSVPIAAQPAFIEGKMFIDGGARFGVLPARMLELAKALRTESAVPGTLGSEPPRPNLFIIVNGTLEAGSLCDLKKCNGAAPDPFPLPAGATSRKHLGWSFPDLAFRSLSILINESYVSSVELARRDAQWCRRALLAGQDDQCAASRDDGAMDVHFVRILPQDMRSEDLKFGVNGLRRPVETDNPFEGGLMPCDAWSKADDTLEKPKPHEFHPRYMRCLIRYGARMADDLHWQTFEP